MLRSDSPKQKMPLIKYPGLFDMTFGQAAFASFLICAISGVFLAIPYDVHKPLESISLILLINPAAVLFRNVHFWSAQAFLILSLLHIWDHLRKSTEQRVKTGIWFRLTSSILVMFFVMLSGFILKGDLDSLQARQIVNFLLESIPFIGKTIAYSLIGQQGDYQILYVQHIATCTIILWAVIAEHTRTIYPTLRHVLYLVLPIVLIGYIIPPGLHDNFNPVIKGPWYFLGLQEILHWLNYPVLIIPFLLGLILIIYLMQRLPEKFSFPTKKILLWMSVVYFLLCLFGFFFRGENWAFTLPWKNPAVLNYEFNNFRSIRGNTKESLIGKVIPVIQGRFEGCLFCHESIRGLSASHDPKAIGCVSCHSGNPFTLDKTLAHRNMILIPGNLDNASLSCGSANCHPDIIPRVNSSIMTTMSGVVTVDKYVFGETDSLSGINFINKIGSSPAEGHLRNLCASCHLGNRKEEFGPVDQLSRGGGCNACHLSYEANALNELRIYKKSKGESSKEFIFNFHPSLSIKISADKCFGCHSRSGRIATNYEGWHETRLKAEEMPASNDYRKLDDGRVFKKVIPDVHYEMGLTCIGCHISREVMGDGTVYAHKEEQVKVQCIDCHSHDVKTKKKDQLDSESGKILSLRTFPADSSDFVVTQKENLPLLNMVSVNNKVYLYKKETGDSLLVKEPITQCIGFKAHERLSCNSCHSSWAPQCVGCHTEYKPEKESFDLLDNKVIRGDWMEYPGEFHSDASALGIKVIKDVSGTTRETIDTFIPGMILSIDKAGYKSSSKSPGTVFRRLYAPAFSHTITKKSRTCISCHNTSLALGYGRGELIYTKYKGFGRWFFNPAYKADTHDNLPEDAWTGFLMEREDNSSTRNGARPFNISEQKKILTVGSCLTCHKPESRAIKIYLSKPNNILSRISPKCIPPGWN